MYEIIKNIKFVKANLEQGKSTVLATIFKTVGSSYRKQWTQMVVGEDMTYEGALSGGCVEREVLRQANKLFFTKGRSQFEYDGTEKLGCKGRIWVCLEYLSSEIAIEICNAIERVYHDRSVFTHGIGNDGKPYTYFKIKGKILSVSGHYDEDDDHEVREVQPQNRVVIVGGEFDSFILARTAQWAGIDAHLIVYKDFVKPSYTPEYKINRVDSDEIGNYCRWDRSTALILMTHSMERDFTYLKNLIHMPLRFIGALGPSDRKDNLINRFQNEMDLTPELRLKLNSIKGPVGIDINAKTPEEISISIISQLVQVFNK